MVTQVSLEVADKYRLHRMFPNNDRTWSQHYNIWLKTNASFGTASSINSYPWANSRNLGSGCGVTSHLDNRSAILFSLAGRCWTLIENSCFATKKVISRRQSAWKLFLVMPLLSTSTDVSQQSKRSLISLSLSSSMERVNCTESNRMPGKSCWRGAGPASRSNFPALPLPGCHPRLHKLCVP